MPADGTDNELFRFYLPQLERRPFVVTVGGTSSITGPFVASLLIGIADVTGKYYVPKFGAFVIYTIMIVLLLVRPQGLFARAAGK